MRVSYLQPAETRPGLIEAIATTPGVTPFHDPRQHAVSLAYVVPVEGAWQHDAFSGAVVDGHVWGRSTLDDKGCLVGICEAVPDV